MFGSKRIAQRVVESAVSVEFIERARCGCAEDSARYSKLRLLVVTVVLFCATIMPARARTITVTNTNDNGPGSLRQALHDANDGDTINFAVTGTITLTSGGLPINKSITISGPGADQLSIDGNQAIVVFGVFFWQSGLPPDLPAIIGKAALRQYVESSLQVPGFRITWSTDEAVLSPDGQFAYLLGNNAVTMDDPTGEPVTTKGRAVTIWQRGTDGEWRCAVDIWNAEPTAGRPR